MVAINTAPRSAVTFPRGLFAQLELTAGGPILTQGLPDPAPPYPLGPSQTCFLCTLALPLLHQLPSVCLRF